MRIEGAGVCHFDRFIDNGNRVQPTPMPLGHAAAGIVEQRGDDFTGLVRRDRIVMTFSHYLGVSAGAIHAVMTRAPMIYVEPDVATDVPALSGCAVLTGGGAVLDSAKPEPGEAMMVVGLGGVATAANPVTVALTAPDSRASVTPRVLTDVGHALRHLIVFGPEDQPKETA